MDTLKPQEWQTAEWQIAGTLQDYLRWKVKQLGITQGDLTDDIKDVGSGLKAALFYLGRGIGNEEVLERFLDRINEHHKTHEGEDMSSEEKEYVVHLNNNTRAKYFAKGSPERAYRASSVTIDEEELSSSEQRRTFYTRATPLQAPSASHAHPDMELHVDDALTQHTAGWRERVAEKTGGARAMMGQKPSVSSPGKKTAGRSAMIDTIIQEKEDGKTEAPKTGRGAMEL